MKMVKRLGALVLSIWLAAGCSGILLPGQTPTDSPSVEPTRPEVTPSVPAVPGAGGSNGALPPGTTPGHVTLTVWVPPEFDPAASTPAAQLFSERLDAFSETYPGVTVETRVKALNGPASLLEALSAGSAAAPAALPDLVALPRAQLQVAALKGLVTPFDGLTTVMDDVDWYAYAQGLALLQGSTFGLPFAGDALVLLYRPSQVNQGLNPADWTTLLGLPAPLAFPAADPDGLVTLALYLSEGGALQDSQGRPVLEADKLARVLAHYQGGAQLGVFPYWITQFEQDQQAWQVYSEQRVPMVITWVSRYLKNLSPDTTPQVLPAGDQGSLTLMDGWMWALAGPLPDNRDLAAQLAEFLVDPEFLSPWSQAAGYLPPRPSALAAWTDQEIQSFLSQISSSAQPRPDNDLLSSLGPVLRDAALEELKNQGDPVETAQTAAERLGGSE